MIDKDLTNELLKLYDSCIFIIDNNIHKALSVYYSSTLTASNISYEDLGHELARLYNLKDNFADKIDRFMTNLNTKDRSFYITLNYESNNGNKLPFILRGYKMDDDKYIFTYYQIDFNKIDVDELTKTQNKNKIYSYVKELFERNKTFLLIKYSIDRFEELIEQNGHLFGDIVLIETSALIKNLIGSKGMISRIGLYNFAIALEIEDDYDTIYKAISKIRFIVESINLHNISKKLISATIGCVIVPNDAKTIDEAIAKAEIAFNRAVKKGRDNFVIYTEEKCGLVPPNYKIEFYDAKIPIPSHVSTHNITVNTIKLLAQDEVDYSINEALSIIGNFFILDRICYLRFNFDKDKPEAITWLNPSNRVILPKKCISKENYLKWVSCKDSYGMIKINQVDSNKTHVLYQNLKDAKTTAVLAFTLEYNNQILGLLICDMCSTNRFWNRDEISALSIISNIFAIKTYKDIEKVKHYTDLYIDPTTGVYNYKKWFLECNDYVQQNLNINYSILQIRIEDFINIKTLMEQNQINKLYKDIANNLIKFDNIIFCHDQDDKFNIFVKSTNKDEILNIYNKLSNQLNRIASNNRYKIILAGGVYINETKEELNKAINLAMITSKNANKNILFFSEELYEKEKTKTRIELHMHDALANNEFLLYLQPKIDSNTGKLVGAEALTRWFFLNSKIIFPNLFIPIFEENGFIEELDYRVFENVCIFQRKAIDNNLLLVPISLNVSRYIKDFDKYLNTINNIREKYNIPANLIEIEITEGMFYNNDDEIAHFIEMLHESGYVVLMDDFGSGYSNISSLATLKFDYIKIDKSLAEKYSDKHKIVVSSLISIIKNLNMGVICEGVETPEYRDFLKECDCNIIQGYLYDKPLPEEEFKNKYIIIKQD